MQTCSFHREQMDTLREKSTTSLERWQLRNLQVLQAMKISMWNKKPLYQTTQENTFYIFQR